MAFENQDSNTVAPVVQPTPQDAPTGLGGPVPGPDLSALVRPGASITPGQPSPNDPNVEKMQGYAEQSQTELEKARAAGVVPPPPPPGKHDTLFRIINAIGQRLAGASTSLA